MFRLESTDENTFSPTHRTVEFSAESLDDIIDQFTLFLKGSGFCFDRLYIITDSYDEMTTSNEFNIDLGNFQYGYPTSYGSAPKMKANNGDK
jgi:hypothetical protein